MTSRDAPVLEPLWSAAEARAADAYTIEHLGVPGIVLMEHAGRAVADVVARGVAGRATRSALVIAGPGNNGGDGWVIARHLWGRGIPCPVVTLASPDTLQGDASLVAQMFLTAAEARSWTCDEFGAPFFLVDLADDLEHIIAVTAPDVVVDAIFGTGLNRAVEGVASRVIEALARCDVPIVSVDVASGLPTDGQAPLGPVVRAAATVTFERRRIAHCSEPGRALSGEVHVVDIGILDPPLDARAGAGDGDGAGGAAGERAATSSAARVQRLVDARGLVPSVDVDAHKGKHGHVGVLVGHATGAARLAGRAAFRAGAGLVSLLTHARSSSAGATPAPPGALAGESVDAELMMRADGSLDGITACVVGSGLGAAHVDAARALLEACAQKGVPCVVDAEGVDALSRARIDGLVAIATPHPGEAARALGVTAGDVQRDRIAAARALAEKLGPDVVLVLKGSSPLVVHHASGALEIIVVEGGHPALAVAGSGDVLAGALAGLLARKVSPLHAARAGGEAPQRAGRDLGERGALASEIADAMRAHLVAAAPGAVAP